MLFISGSLRKNSSAAVESRCSFGLFKLGKLCSFRFTDSIIITDSHLLINCKKSAVPHPHAESFKEKVRESTCPAAGSIFVRAYAKSSGPLSRTTQKGTGVDLRCGGGQVAALERPRRSIHYRSRSTPTLCQMEKPPGWAAFPFGAGYGSRTRLASLGSWSNTDIPTLRAEAL